jgi:hypothetical protein
MIAQPPGTGIANAQGFYQNITAFLRDFCGTFTTSFPASVILHSVKADDTLSSEPVTV